MKVLIPLREALSDARILGGALVGDSWAGWKSLLLACAGEKLTDNERVLFTALTGGRESEPGDRVLAEAFLCIGGRRGGKSRSMATFCAWMASCIDWSDCLSLGERGRVMFVAPSMDQARVTMDYCRALFHDSELLTSLVENELSDELHLKRRIIFEVQAASAAHSRGKTAVAIVCDESAFLKSGDAINSDEDVVTALRPSLATTGGPLLLTSSPAGAEGLVYQLYKRHFGPTGDARCIVAKGSTKELNPSIRTSVIDRAYEQDAEAAASEYGAEFREPAASYLTRELIERAIDKGITSRVRLPGIQYVAFCDCSSGAGRDSMAMCIGHLSSDRDRPVVVIDFIAEQKPPFDPVECITFLCGHLKAWNINTVYGDQYGMPYITTFSRKGIAYQVASPSTSEIYLHALPSWTAGAVCMLDGHTRSIDQLVALKRKYQNGRESVSHPDRSNAHDDLATVISGAIWLCTPIDRQVAWDFGGIGVVSQPRVHVGDGGEASETMQAWIATQGYTRAPDGGLGKRGSGHRPGSVVW
jgi:hypothetical protein